MYQILRYLLLIYLLSTSAITYAYAQNYVLSLDGDGDMEAISIEGTLLMLDDATPHVAVVVQAVDPSPGSDGEPVVAATVLSNEFGKYQFINLKPGNYQVRCQSLGEYIYFGQKAGKTKGAILKVEPGKTLGNIDFRFPPIKKGSWRHYTSLDGLAHNTVSQIYVDADGFMWLGTDTSRISRFDGREFLNFSTKANRAEARTSSLHSRCITIKQNRRDEVTRGENSVCG